jgi:hypothetical protein
MSGGTMSNARADARVGLSFPFDRLWTQREAAAYLQVSERYLRASTCPKQLLPGTGIAGKPIVRYAPAAVEAWAHSRSAGRRFS